MRAWPEEDYNQEGPPIQGYLGEPSLHDKLTPASVIEIYERDEWWRCYLSFPPKTWRVSVTYTITRPPDLTETEIWFEVKERDAALRAHGAEISITEVPAKEGGLRSRSTYVK
jgi:hypothetical protein